MSLVNEEQAKLGKLIDGKHPIYGSKKIDEIKGKKNTLLIYDYPLNIDYSSDEESISIIFVGQSGTGKSTFINAYVNYLLGITSNDDIRYKLILGGDKEKDQTKSQTDKITIYNVRSPKYNNKLFKLIDTPGAGDTRNNNEETNSKIEQDQKEKEFLKMYNDIFSKDIGQLNCITFVVKGSENRENEFQKKIIKAITNLFAGDIDKNCLAILTHVDSDDNVPDAVQLLEKMDIFKKKSDMKEEWYFSVSSKSYFSAFQKGKPSVSSMQFESTEESFEKYTQKLFTLKLYYTKQTQKNLAFKEQQEKIIKVLKDDIMDHVFVKIKELKDNKNNLSQKIKECDEKQKKIEQIKIQIQNEDNQRKLIEVNYNTFLASKSEKEKELKENNEKINNLNNEKNLIDEEIKTIDLNQRQAENDKREAEEKQKLLNNEIKKIEEEIKHKETQINVKKNESIETQEYKNAKESYEKAMEELNSFNGDTEEMKQLKQYVQNSINTINEIDKDIQNKDTAEIKETQKKILDSEAKITELKKTLIINNNDNSQKMKTLLDALEKSRNIINDLDNKKQNTEEAKRIEELKKSLEEKKNKVNVLNNEIDMIDKNKKELENQKSSAEENRQALTQQISDSEKEKEELENQLKLEKEKLEKNLKEKEDKLDEEKNNQINLKIKERDDAINKIKKEVENKIKQLEEEMSEKIPSEEVYYYDDYNYTSLVCINCKKNCHDNCDCWTIFGYKPNFLCDIIKKSHCVTCKCHTDYHKRGKFYYKRKPCEKPLSPASKKKIENNISILKETLKTRTEYTKSEYNNQITQVKINYDDEQKREKEKYEKELKKAQDNKNKSINKYMTSVNTNSGQVNIYDIEIANKENIIKEKESNINKKNEEKKRIIEDKEKEEKELEELLKNLENKKDKIEQEKNIEYEKQKNQEKDLQQLQKQQNSEIEKTKKEEEEIKLNKKIQEENLEQLKIKRENEIKEKKEEKKRLKEEQEKKEKELQDLEQKREKEKNDLKQKEIEKKELLEKTRKEIEDKKNREINDLEEAKKNNETIQKNKKDELDKIKKNEELNKLKIKEEEQKKNTKKIEQEKKDQEIKAEIERKIEKENKIKEVNSQMDEVKQNLEEKEKIIKNKNEEVGQMTSILEQIFQKDKEKLEEKEKVLQEELIKYKNNAIRQFLIIKIINEEIEKLTLNKSTVNNVFALIQELLKNEKFIDDRKYFYEVIEEYKKISNDIDIIKKEEEKEGITDEKKVELLGQTNAIYLKYGVDSDSIRKIEKED